MQASTIKTFSKRIALLLHLDKGVSREIYIKQVGGNRHALLFLRRRLPSQRQRPGYAGWPSNWDLEEHINNQARDKRRLAKHDPPELEPNLRPAVIFRPALRQRLQRTQTHTQDTHTAGRAHGTHPAASFDVAAAAPAGFTFGSIVSDETMVVNRIEEERDSARVRRRSS